jgi:hypothetical protein
MEMNLIIKRTQITLSIIICVVAFIYAIMIYIKLDGKFAPNNMERPGMVIAFLSANCFNIARLLSGTRSRAIYNACLLSATLTLAYATAFSILEYSSTIGKIVVTLFMAVVWLFLVRDFFLLRKKS